VTIKVPPRTRCGSKLRVSGRGAPLRGRAKKKGDLYVTLMAQLPEGQDPRLEELARQLEPLYAGRDLRRDLKV
jgi:DnaJ-class molecular chaperone